MVATGRYELRETLRENEFTRLARAWDPALHCEVAVKSLLSPAAANARLRERFLTVGRSLAGIDHPGVVAVLDVGEADDTPFIAMRWIEGASLAEPGLGDRPLPLIQAAGIFARLADAVDAVHAVLPVHGGITAANVMIERGGRLILLDPGVAGLLDEPPYPLGLTAQSVEAIAPEVVLGQVRGPAADVYALGVLAYRLLTGRPPFVGDVESVQQAHAHEPLPPLWELRPGLPGTVYAAVLEAMSKQPSRRQPTASAFARALAEPRVSAPRRPLTSALPRGAVRHFAELPPAKVASDGDRAAGVNGNGRPRPDEDSPPVASVRGSSRRRLALTLGAAGALLVAAVAGVVYRASHREERRPTVRAAAQVAAPSRAPQVEAEVIRVNARDNEFMPATVTVPAGQEVSVVFTNSGAALHNWRVIDLKTAAGADVGSRLLPGGGTETVRFTVPRPGTYGLICDVHPAEMRGTLVAR